MKLKKCKVHKEIDREKFMVVLMVMLAIGYAIGVGIGINNFF